MRVQTNFENLVAATNGQLFGWSFIGLRVFIGVVFMLMALQSGAIAWWNPDLNFSASEIAWSSLTQIMTLILGLSLIVGLLVRPASVVMLAYMLGSLVITFNSGELSPDIWVLYIPIALVFGMYASGGAGHALGLDGVVLRNLRRPNAVTKFLFG